MTISGKPYVFFCILAKCPKLCLFISFSVLLASWIATGVLCFTNHDIIKLQMEILPTRIESSISQTQSFTFYTWMYDFSKDYMNVNINFKMDQQFFDHHKVDLFYKVKGNILTMKHLVRIKKLEDEITRLAGYDQYYGAPRSLIPYLVTKDEKLDVRNQNELIALTLTTMLNQNQSDVKKLLKYALPPSFKFEPKRKVHSHLLRSVIMPGKKTFGKFGSSPQQAFRDNLLRPFLKNKSRGATASDDFEFRYWGQDLYWQDLRDQALNDMKYVIGSIAFLVAILLVHTQSLILTTAAIFGILSSVLCGNLVYRYIFDYRYLGLFHSVALFVILGIGVDDVFVLFDVWRDSFDSGHSQPMSLAHRLSEVYRKSALPMFVTSITSALAFFVNVFCEVPIVYTFGLFTSVVIICNYLMVITFLPCVLINQLLFCEWIKDIKWMEKTKFHVCLPRWASVNVFAMNIEKKPEERWMARLFGDYFFAVIQIKMVAMSMIAVLVSASVFFIWRSTMVTPTKSHVLQLFTAGTNWYEADILDREMGLQAAKIRVELVWGLKLEDRSKCHRHDFKCSGDTRYDDQLDLNLWEAQLALLDFCKRFDSDDELVKKLRVKRVDGKSLVECFLEDMHRDMLYQRKPSVSNCSDGKPLDLTIPVGQVKVSRLASCRSSIYGGENFAKKVALDRWYDRNIETAIFYWLAYSKVGQNIPAESRVKSYDRWHVALETPRFLNDSHRISYLMRRKRYSGRIRVMHVAVELNVSFSDDYATGLSVKSNWERFVQESNAKFPLGLKGVFSCMSQRAPRSPLTAWIAFEVQAELWNNARLGISMGLFGVALPILFLSTRNIVLTFAGIVCLIFIISAVMAMCQLMGWTLGVSESINFCVSTGLCVDYVIHFLEAYYDSSATTRKEKVHDMLRRMGGAVSSGAVTTIGATSFLFASSVIFFQQFGAFMGTALGCSYLYALFLLTPFLLLFGPEGKFGSLEPMMLWMFLRIKSCVLGQHIGSMPLVSDELEHDTPVVGLKPSSKLPVKTSVGP